MFEINHKNNIKFVFNSHRLATPTMKLTAIAFLLTIYIIKTESYHDLTSRDCRDWRTWMNLTTRDNIRIPHESDCTRFYECQHGGLFKKKCDVRQIYDPFRKVCEWDYKTNCTIFEDYSKEMEKIVGRQAWMI